MKYCQAIKRDKLLIHTATEMNLIYIVLNFKKPDRKNYVLIYLCDILKKENLVVGNRSLVRSLGECDYKIVKGSFLGGGDGTLLYLDYADGYTTTHLSKLIQVYT